MSDRQKPRIALLHYSAPPTIGGVESTIAAHARLLADHGYAVKIIAGRGQPQDARVPLDLAPLMDSRDSRILEVNHKLASGTIPTDFDAVVSALRDLLEIKLADVDICIVHNALTLHKNLALTTALHDLSQRGVRRFIGWCHDFAWTDPVYAADLHSGLPWDLLRNPWNGVRYVVVSEQRRRELASLLSLSDRVIQVVPPGLDLFEFLGVGPMAARWYWEFKLAGAAPLLLLPARVTRRKNIERAIAITAALRRQGLAPKLIVMGPLGPHNPANALYLNELSALRDELGVGEAVILLNEHGPVDDSTRRDLYLLADVLLFTSEREGFGIPILEAAAAGLPIFCSDIAPFRESAQDWAHYFAPGDSPDFIAEGMARFLQADARYQLKRRVLREYTWDRLWAERIEPLLAEVW
ncbi:MAG: glycosyltransferase family 4 protein [Anaerolineae bacterium]